MIISRASAFIVRNATSWRFQFECWFDGCFDIFFHRNKIKEKKNEIPNERKIMVEKWGVFLIDQRLYPNKPVQAISNCYYPLLTLFIWKMIANMIIQVVYNCQSILLSINISASEDNGHDVIQEKKCNCLFIFFFNLLL